MILTKFQTPGSITIGLQSNRPDGKSAWVGAGTVQTFGKSEQQVAQEIDALIQPAALRLREAPFVSVEELLNKTP